MAFLKNHSYKICVNVTGRILTFSCKIVEEDEHFVTFIDKFGKELSYNKINIISSEEVKE